MRKEFRELRSLEEALDVLESMQIDPRAERRPLEEAVGHVLVETVRSPIDVPGFDRSVMDGYAVVAADTVGAYDDNPIELDLIGEVPAGAAPTVEVDRGETAEIATGAPIPSGADAVVMVERTRRDGSTVHVHRPVTPGENLMRQGADIAAGGVVLRAGQRLDPRRIGLAAALGIDRLPVLGRPVVGLVSTGAEIVKPGEQETLGPGQIFDINAYSLAAAVEDAGGRPRQLPHAVDAYDRIRETLESAAEECDLVISTGSTSASAEDVVYRVIEDAGELLLHGVAIKPGKPTIFGRLEDTPVLGLPGNPISALMTFQMFARPLIREASGLEDEGDAAMVDATLATDVESVFGRTQLLPVGLVESPSRGVLAYDVHKGSGAITSLTDADGYLTIDDNVNYLEGGSTVTVQLLGSGIEPPDVLLGGEACPHIARVIDGYPSHIRWLDTGALDGARKVRDGIADLAGVNLDVDDLDELTPSNARLYRGYERRVVLVHREDGVDSLADAVGGDATIGVLPPETGLGQLGDRLLAAEGGSDAARRSPSQSSAIEAVRAGELDAAIVLEAVATEHGLAMVPLRWEHLDLLVADERLDKTAVERLLDDLVKADKPATAGIRYHTDAGDLIARW